MSIWFSATPMARNGDCGDRDIGFGATPMARNGDRDIWEERAHGA
ncbi:MAG: hypothetical protein RR893_10370 [Clostridia bacterium]